MKALITLTFALSFAQASVAAVAANSKLNGQALETQAAHSEDGQLFVAGAASLNEVGHTESATEQIIYFNAEPINGDPLSVLHDADTLTLTLIKKGAVQKDDQVVMNAQIAILADDDQIRRAEGQCVSAASGVLNCSTIPTSNPDGLLKDSKLVLNLK